MPLPELPATEMARLVRRGELSPVELVQTHFDRIHELNSSLNAFVNVPHDRALAEGSAIETSEHLASLPLAGVPVSIKCCIDLAGVVCDAGSRVRQRYVAGEDAILVARLKAAGAIVLGNTNCAEMLMAYDTDNALHGRTANPYDVARTAGGSSGGEAAAVASGMSALGVGSDGGGSIRVPAHFCGIYGLKPTPGRIPTGGHFPPSLGPFTTLGVVGPMARSMDDLRLAYSVLSATKLGDTENSQTRRVGILDDMGEATAETRAAVAIAARTLERAGNEVEPFRSRSFESAERLWQTLFVRVAGGMLVAQAVASCEDEISEPLRKFLAIATAPPQVTADELLQCLIERDLVQQQFLQEIAPYDALLLPVSSGPAFPHGEGGWDDRFSTNYLRDMRFSQWFNLLALPAISVPAALSAEGLPIGVQLVAKPWKEATVFALAAIIAAELAGSARGALPLARVAELANI